MLIQNAIKKLSKAAGVVELDRSGCGAYRAVIGDYTVQFRPSGDQGTACNFYVFSQRVSEAYGGEYSCGSYFKTLAAAIKYAQM
ncbi:MAG: hypothetical protein AAGI68_16125 [Planctomycetota bacterium]